jgi:hypothetical protein
MRIADPVMSVSFTTALLLLGINLDDPNASLSLTNKSLNSRLCLSESASDDF